MPFPEGFTGHQKVQEHFSQSVLLAPEIFIPKHVDLSDLILPDQSLALPYQSAIEETIKTLGLLPDDGRLPVHNRWKPHTNSAGKYFVEYEVQRPNPLMPEKADRYHVYSYVLPPGQTSIHEHDAFEFYILHAGEYYLTLNEEEGRLDRYTIVAPGVEHRGRAGEENPAVVTTVTYNPLDISLSHLHQYRWTPAEWTQAMSVQVHEMLDTLEDAA